MKILYFLPPLLLLGSFADGLPYSYFQILRWIVAGFAIYYTWFLNKRIERLSETEKKYHIIMGYIFAGIAIVFNPIAPIHFERTTWLVIDALTVMPMAVNGMFHFRRK